MRSWMVLALGLSGCAGELRDWREVSAAGGDGVAERVWESGDYRREQLTLSAQGHTPVADYLFVVDNSKSMGNVLDKFRAGFARLDEVNPFPAKARIAVMSTLPGDPRDLRRLHPAVRKRRGLSHDPGFLRLIDRNSIARYRKLAGQREAFKEPGCSAWFSPTDTNERGTSCLVAHTQIAMEGVRVEAGLTAVGQMLRKHQGRPLFRPGAAVNIIFVSDTHDPGVNEASQPRVQAAVDALIAARPDYATLAALVQAQGPVASFRIHAIAPRSECSEPWSNIGPVYFDAAERSGGYSVDLCSTDDFSGVIADIAEDGAAWSRPVLPLSRPVAQVEVVRVDGAPVPFVVDHGVVVLDQDLPIEPATVEVIYKTGPVFRSPPLRQPTVRRPASGHRRAPALRQPRAPARERGDRRR